MTCPKPCSYEIPHEGVSEKTMCKILRSKLSPAGEKEDRDALKQDGGGCMPYAECLYEPDAICKINGGVCCSSKMSPWLIALIVFGAIVGLWLLYLFLRLWWAGREGRG